MRLILGLLFAANTYAAAVLQISSATIAADGVTISVPIGSCSTPLSPSSGITGFTAYNTYQGAAATISAATASGCTVTLTMPKPVAPSEGPLTISLATAGGSNLTDAGGNTPSATGNTSITVDISATQWLYTSSVASSVRYEGAFLDNSSYHNVVQFLSADGCVRFSGSPTLVGAYVYNGSSFGNRWTLKQDGTEIHDWGALTADGNYSVQTPVTGLSGSHTYSICNVAAQSVYPQIVSFRVDAALGTRPAAGQLIARFGSSIVQYWGSEYLTDSRLGDMYQFSTSLGLQDQFWGQSGATTCAVNSVIAAKSTFTAGTNYALAIIDTASIYNDVNASESTSTVAACITSDINLLLALPTPPTKILVTGMIPIAAGQGPYTPYDTAVQAAVVAFANPSITWVSPLTWINTTANPGSCSVGAGDRQSDALHIEGCGAGTNTGYAKYGIQLGVVVSSILSGGAGTSKVSGAVVSGATIQ